MGPIDRAEPACHGMTRAQPPCQPQTSASEMGPDHRYGASQANPGIGKVLDQLRVGGWDECEKPVRHCTIQFGGREGRDYHLFDRNSGEAAQHVSAGMLDRLHKCLVGLVDPDCLLERVIGG